MRLSFRVVGLTLFFLARTAAAADDPEKLFADGNALMDQGKFAEALPKFQEAERLDPGVGTQFNIAVCQEKIGQTASAYRHFEEVATLAHASGKKQREDAARQKLTELAPRLAVFVISTRDQGEVLVKVDGAIVPKEKWSAYPVDPGAHHVEAIAALKEPWKGDFPAPGSGQKAEVVVPMLVAAQGKTVTITRQSSNTRRTLGYVVGSVGIAGLVVAGVTSVMILNDHSTAKDNCTAPPVAGGSENRCAVDANGSSPGADAVNQGRTLVPINAIAWGVGIVGVGVGTFLVLISGHKSEPQPKSAWLVEPSVTPLAGGAFFGVRGSL